MHEAPEPIDVGRLGPDTVMPADDVADLVDQPGLATRRERILMSVHARFPDRPRSRPLAQILRRQGLAGPGDAQPSYNTVSKPPPSPLSSRGLSGGDTGGPGVAK